MLPITILFGRGIEDIPDSYEKCRLICKADEEYNNKKIRLEMDNLNSLVENLEARLRYNFL